MRSNKEMNDNPVPGGAVALAQLLREGWRARGCSEKEELRWPVRSMGHGLVATAGWILAARNIGANESAGHGGSGSFGRFGNCDARRRCVGCEGGCDTEAALIALHRRFGLRVMMIEIAGGIAVPRWAQVRLWIPHSLSLSGPWRPALKREVPEVCLLSADGRTILTPLPNDIDTRFSGLQQPSITVGERR
ncbi:hypothetical protein, partial [Thermaurantiacus sp.]